jgi:hypothetical protein
LHEEFPLDCVRGDENERLWAFQAGALAAHGPVAITISA